MYCEDEIRLPFCGDKQLLKISKFTMKRPTCHFQNSKQTRRFRLVKRGAGGETKRLNQQGNQQSQARLNS